jgi:hypothetical protein
MHALGVPNYPASIEPAPADVATLSASPTATAPPQFTAITSTISQNGDNGADPNKLVKATDLISATQPATTAHLDRFVTIRSSRAGEVFRGVALAPEEDGR